MYRFRYQIYIEELKYNYAADHERKRLKQDEDDKPYTTLLYTGTPGDITSSLRVRIWEPGEVPPRVFEDISLDRFPGVERLRVAHLGRLMVRRTLRGKLVVPSLLVGAYEMGAERGCDLAFLDCVPGIVRHYRQLGARPYGGRLLDLGYSPGVPLVVVLSDYAHFKRCGSVVAPLVRKYFGPGKHPPLDLTPYHAVFDGSRLPVELDPLKVWTELEEGLLADEDEVPTFADRLTPSALKRLTASGYLLTVDMGELITREGIGQREMYVILEGLCHVESSGRHVALLEKGDLFGEIAFFSEAGERSATVRAISRCRLLVLRKKFLEELAQKDPEAAYQIMLNVSRIMAERLKGMIDADTHWEELAASVTDGV